MKRLILTLLFIVPVQTRQVILVVVVDQVPHWFLTKTKSHLRHGIAWLLNNGISYEYAYYPNTYPQTAPGHTLLSTGAMAKDHGIISNVWYEKDMPVLADDDPLSPVLGNATQHKSARNIMVPTLCDQMMLASNMNNQTAACALSLKSNAAIALAGHAGTAFWFDEQIGAFTTSTAYLTQLPDFVRKHTNKNRIDLLHTISWIPLYASTTGAYASAKQHSTQSTPCIGPNYLPSISAAQRYALIPCLPFGQHILTDLACDALDTYLENNVQKLLCFVSYSGLDKITHVYGHESKEALDMWYHIDFEVGRLIKHLQQKKGLELVLVFTSDHGGMPTPESVRDAGYTPTRRIVKQQLIAQLNTHLERMYKRAHLILERTENQFLYFSPLVRTLPITEQHAIEQATITFLQAQPGIKNAWLCAQITTPHPYANQLFPGRSGDIILEPYPYTLITAHETGTGHTSPYEYDVHVPVCIWMPKKQQKRVYEKVFINQIAPTLAHLLHIALPAGCVSEVLPGIF